MITKIKIARLLIVLGFILNLGSYALQLFDLYSEDGTSIVFNIDDNEEKSESNEKENSEKEDLKKKDKISQYNDENPKRICDLIIRCYPEFYFYTVSVYLEYTTPPPRLS